MFESKYLMFDQQPLLLIFPCSHLGDSCLRGKWPQRLEVPPTQSPVDRVATLAALPFWPEVTGLERLLTWAGHSWAYWPPLNATLLEKMSLSLS